MFEMLCLIIELNVSAVLETTCFYFWKRTRAQRRLQELQQVERGGERKFSLTFFFFFFSARNDSEEGPVRLSEEEDRISGREENAGAITASYSSPSSLFVPPRMKAKSNECLAFVPEWFAPSQAERTYTIRGDEM